VSKKSKTPKPEARRRKPKAFYARKPPKPGRASSVERREQKAKAVGRASSRAGMPSTFDSRPSAGVRHPHFLAPSHFTIREDGSIQLTAETQRRGENESEKLGASASPRLIFTSDSPFIRLYHGNCFELLDAIYAKYGDEGRFDCIFADPPYFLSNGGITCHAGKMVKVDKGDWDKSRGPELNHEFTREWLLRCQRVLKPNGTIWVTGTQHVIFSIGYAMQQLGYKILNDIAWEKPNPPPNLSCRYFTHSTETILWAAKNEKSKHVFNYQEMRKVTGKQMKTVWRKEEFTAEAQRRGENESEELSVSASPRLDNIWTMSAPGSDEKVHGKHPTQKPVALVERCLLASTNPGELVLDPFLGGGTTAVAAIRLKRGCVGIEADLTYITMAAQRCDRQIIEIWLRHFRVRIDVSIARRDELHESQIDLAIIMETINGSRRMAGVPEIQTERIFHETKFVFLACRVGASAKTDAAPDDSSAGAVVHTTVDVSLQEAWAKTPTGKKRETTHIVRCETEIYRVKDD
jgi:site-specific DNA-methyltransferase (adenine-specific)